MATVKEGETQRMIRVSVDGMRNALERRVVIYVHDVNYVCHIRRLVIHCVLSLDLSLGFDGLFKLAWSVLDLISNLPSLCHSPWLLVSQQPS